MTLGWGGGQDQGEVALTGAPARLCAAPRPGPASPPPSCRRCRDLWGLRVVLLGFRQTQAGKGSAHVPAEEAGGEGDREDQRERQTGRDRQRETERRGDLFLKNQMCPVCAFLKSIINKGNLKSCIMNLDFVLEKIICPVIGKNILASQVVD